MQPGAHLAVFATVLVVLAFIVGSAVMFVAGSIHPGATGPQGTAGQNGTAGASGANGTSGAPGTNGSNGQNGTDGTNGTTWISQWYGFNASFLPTGNLTYLAVSVEGCTGVGSGAYYCTVNVSNTCGPKDTALIQPAWACKNYEFALVNVSYAINGSFYFAGSNPSLGYALGWGQSIEIQLWFQTIVCGVYASGSSAPTVPTLTPAVELGFAQVAN